MQKLVQSQQGGAFFGSLAKAVLPVVGGLAGTLNPILYVGSAIGGAAEQRGRSLRIKSDEFANLSIIFFTT